MREKKIKYGQFMDVEIFPYTTSQQDISSRGTRSKKKKESTRKQKNLNDKNALKSFRRVANANFGKDDLHMTYTFDRKFAPKTVEGLHREARNLISRIRTRIKKKEKGEKGPKLKYIIVMEWGDREGDKIENPHLHVLINRVLDRDTLEEVWEKNRRGKKPGQRMGRVKSQRLQPDENGIEGLARYISKQKKNRSKRWIPSLNLERPVSRTNDHKYSRRKIEKIAREMPPTSFWEKQYPGYTVAGKDYSYEVEFNLFTGWSLYIKLRKLE
jgi:hypothetical protein